MQQTTNNTGLKARKLVLAPLLVTAMGASFGFGTAQAGCPRVADRVFQACRFETLDDYFLATAICENVPDAQERKPCRREAAGTRREGMDLCRDQRQARKELCALTGETHYAPDFDPANFVDPDDIGNSVAPNPYFPLIVGSEHVYSDGEETTTVVVTNKVKNIEGVPCRVVNDVVSIDGVPIEDTNDWVAQE